MNSLKVSFAQIHQKIVENGAFYIWRIIAPYSMKMLQYLLEGWYCDRKEMNNFMLSNKSKTQTYETTAPIGLCAVFGWRL